MSSILFLLGVLPLLFHFVAPLSVPSPSDNKYLARSLLNFQIFLSYKETDICETTAGVKSYSGYVHIPPNPDEGRNYPINTFFWFFEARKDPANAPLSLWLQGGPGAPSTPAALGENGPCKVGKDSKSTILNPWSWNNEVNMLYLDQPVQVGFSYDSLINGTIEESASPFLVTPFDATKGTPKLNTTHIEGIFPSQNVSNTASTSSAAALAAWHFMQIWIHEFPKYKPKHNKFSIWSESYGGHYGPTFSDFFNTQNRRIEDGSIKKDSAIPLNLETVGLVNACIDILTQMPTYPEFAYNNTYGIQAINETQYKFAVDSFPECREHVQACHKAADQYDPLALGSNSTVNKACRDANDFCFATMWSHYDGTKRNVFDITATIPGSFPPKYAAGYLNTKEVQDALGVPLNFTGFSPAVSTAFTGTGDFVRGRNLAILGELLDRGVKVAMMYGDSDYQCNWLGGERISLAIESKISPAFQKAGYADILVNDTYSGGSVRQYGNLSFSRVYGAGHEAVWYQPETGYQIFNRVMADVDVATGKLPTVGLPTYSSTGPASVFSIKNALPDNPPAECYFWDIMETCTPAQAKRFNNGTAIMKDFVMIGYVLDNGTAVHY